MTRVALVACAAAALAGRAAEGQRLAPDSLPAGTHVRVASPSRTRTTGALDRVTGTVLAYRGDTLVLRRDRSADTVRVALRDLWALDVGVKRRRGVFKGAGLGLLLGAGIGFGAGFLIPVDDGGIAPNIAPFVTGILGGAVGLVTGTVVGARPVDRWQPVAIRQRSGMHGVPPAGASTARLGVALRF